MDVSGSATYPADLGTTFSLLADGDAAAERYAANGATDVEVLSCGADGDDWVIRTRRVVTVDLPGFARKVLQPTNTIEQTDRWGPERDGRREGSFVVEAKGAPVRTEGTMTIEAVDGGTEHHIEASLDVKVPLIGRKIADWGKGDAQAEVDKELAWNQARLAGGDPG